MIYLLLTDFVVCVDLVFLILNFFTYFQLEMERALLEGEHNTEMEELQQEQERINVLKVQQAELIENSAKEREKVILILQCYILRCRL